MSKRKPLLLDQPEATFLADLLSVAVRHWGNETTLYPLTRVGLREAQRRATMLHARVMALFPEATEDET